MIAGEFNNDAKPDLAVLNFGAVVVLLSNGNGTFQPPKTFVKGGNFGHIAAADLNADGNQDLVVSSGFNGPGINVAIGNGNGTLTPFKKFRAGLKPWGVTIGDFDQDTIPDVVVANMTNLNSRISLLRGLGDGTFARPVSFLVFGRGTRHVASGDFNGDNYLDIAAADRASNSVSILLGNGNGTFLVPKIHHTRGTMDLTLADFDGNDTLDVATSISDFQAVTLLSCWATETERSAWLASTRRGMHRFPWLRQT